MEAESAIARRSGKERKAILRDKEAAEGRLAKWLRMRLLVEVEIAWNDCFETTLNFLPDAGERHGCRTLDVIHLDVDTFVTCDERQAKAAQAKGMKTRWIKP